ncbi:MAG: hypothetical protein ACOC4M_12090, partial [Promethearchaeia archaeon]
LLGEGDFFGGNFIAFRCCFYIMIQKPIRFSLRFKFNGSTTQISVCWSLESFLFLFKFLKRFPQNPIANSRKPKSSVNYQP